MNSKRDKKGIFVNNFTSQDLADINAIFDNGGVIEEVFAMLRKRYPGLTDRTFYRWVEKARK